MFSSSLTSVSAIRSIGAGLAMVAHGASAAVGLAETSEKSNSGTQQLVQDSFKTSAREDFGKSLGCRLECRMVTVTS